MLTVVPPANYSNLFALCAPLNIHLAVVAILAGETPAQIYVDDLDDPHVALIMHGLGHRIYLAGTPGDERLTEEMRQTLLVSASLGKNDATPY
ncbi:MAG TPA: hypothetical protein VKB76_20060, partial [Ktedonobacterales bacterium]|nr:hypothetical protein [Ktedonobacterales bacterium]